MTIGKQIRAKRTEKGLTQRELANLLDLSNNKMIYDYESGRRLPSVTVLLKMSEVLKCKFVIQKDE